MVYSLKTKLAPLGLASLISCNFPASNEDSSDIPISNEPIIEQNCTPGHYFVFAADGFDSNDLLTQHPETKMILDFDYLEASKVYACREFLEGLQSSNKIEFFALYDSISEDERIFPQYFSVIEDDQEPHPSVNEDTYWAHSVTNAGMPRENGYSGQGIRIAILDSGINPNVDLFQNQIHAFYDFVTYRDEVHDQRTHGTFVAGIISLVVPHAEFYVYKMIDHNGFCALTDILEAFNQVIDDDIDVINNSWGLSDERELEGIAWEDANRILNETLERVSQAGTIIVCSSGNNNYYGSISKDQQPPGSPYSIAVGATDIQGEIASFSDLDAHIFSPGEFVYSTRGENILGFGSGTSFSAPFVTAAIALIQQYASLHDYQFDRDDILEILLESADQESSAIILDNRLEIYRFRALNYENLMEYLFENY